MKNEVLMIFSGRVYGCGFLLKQLAFMELKQKTTRQKCLVVQETNPVNGGGAGGEQSFFLPTNYACKPLLAKMFD